MNIRFKFCSVPINLCICVATTRYRSLLTEGLLLFLLHWKQSSASNLAEPTLPTRSVFSGSVPCVFFFDFFFFIFFYLGMIFMCFYSSVNPIFTSWSFPLFNFSVEIKIAFSPSYSETLHHHLSLLFCPIAPWFLMYQLRPVKLAWGSQSKYNLILG